jgi:hypothetical protein
VGIFRFVPLPTCFWMTDNPASTNCDNGLVPIPAEITKLWQVLYEETTMVHAYWQVFNELFMAPQEQMDLMDRSAGFFFLVVQDALATDLQLTIRKLADPPASFGGKKQNATVQHLLKDALKLDPALASTLLPLCKRFTDASEPIRDLRNKVIAHLDLHTATKMVPPPPEITIKEVRTALDALAEFMNALGTHFGEAPTAYQMFGMQGAGPKELIAMLRTADRHLEMQKAGKIPWD